MSYFMTQSYSSPAHVAPGGLGGGEITTTGGVLIAVTGVAILGLIAWGIYTRYEIDKEIAKKEGSSGILKREAGSAVIGLGSELAWRAMEPRRNRSRRRRRKK